jgi:HEAT repeat protein
MATLCFAVRFKYGNFADATIKAMVQIRWWTKAVCLSALAVVLPPGLTLAQSSGPANATTAPETAPSAATTEPFDPLQEAITTLQDPQQPQEVRDLAAKKLVAWHSRDNVKSTLLDELKADRGGQLSVARALAAIPWTDPDFIAPLFTLVEDLDVPRITAAADALANYKSDEDVLRRLLDISRIQGKSDARVPVIRALGTLDQKFIADGLVGLLKDDDPLIQQAAADALADMTGIRTYDRDIHKWLAWWSENAQKSNADFQIELQRHRSDSYMTELLRRTGMEESDLRLLQDIYDQAPQAEQPGILMRYLRNANPSVRELGADEVFYGLGSTNPPSAAAVRETRRLLSDDSSDVRLHAAKALYDNPSSAAAMVGQLQVETDDAVRAALIHSLAPLADVTALRFMVQALANENPIDVQTEAADGLKQGAAAVRADPDLLRSARDALLGALDRTGLPGTEHLQAAILGALGALQDNTLVPQFLHYLVAGQPKEVRQAALTALGELKEPDLADEIIKNLADPDQDIRKAAVQALGTVPQGIYKSSLVDRLNDSDADVAAAAWIALKSWLPDLDKDDLEDLVGQLKNKPNYELEVLLALRDRLEDESKNAKTADARQNAAQLLAGQEQEIGDVMLNNLDQPGPAADYYGQALDFFDSNAGSPTVIDTLCGDRVDALLAAHHWDDAASFASDEIKKYTDNSDPTLRQIPDTIGREFKRAAQKLKDAGDPDSFDQATALFDAVDKMIPPLGGTYPAQLKLIQDQMREGRPATTQSSGG